MLLTLLKYVIVWQTLVTPITDIRTNVLKGLMIQAIKGLMT